MNLNDKIYIAGHNGLVGSAIFRLLQKQGFNNILTRSRDELNLTNQKQVSAWADIYSEMKRRWILSLFVGFVGYLILSRAF